MNYREALAKTLVGWRAVKGLTPVPRAKLDMAMAACPHSLSSFADVVLYILHGFATQTMFKLLKAGSTHVFMFIDGSACGSQPKGGLGKRDFQEIPMLP